MPARKYFYSSTKDGKIDDNGKISDGHISVKDYLTCENTWDEFKMKYMSYYHDHYLHIFIGTCLKYYGLDAFHYFSSPALSWYAIIKMTGRKLEKISDIDKYWFIEKGLRGGISYIAKRYGKTYSKYMNDYDPEKQSTFIS